jgi:xanthine dehydrogenase YagR molybdenum-binding subunit
VGDAAREQPLVAEESMEYGDLAKRYAQQTFGARFVEVGVHAATGEIRLRRMLAVCAAGRILNPKTARSQVIGAMTMGAGAALMEEMVVDRRHGFFVNHDLASYEVPVHADIPHQDVIFLDEVDPTMSPLKAKGVGNRGSLASRRPSPMRSTTPPASACATIRSRSTSTSTNCHRKCK